MATINDPRQYAYNYYINNGFQPHQAAALVGNMQHESGFNPNAVHDNGTGIGVFGWRDPKQGEGRKTDLYTWAKTAGPNGTPLDPTSLDTQLKFSTYEMGPNGKESAAGDAIRNSKDYTGAVNATLSYLRPQDYSAADPTKSHGYTQRFNNGTGLISGVNPVPLPQQPSGGLLAQQPDADLAGYGGSPPQGDDTLAGQKAKQDKQDKALAAASKMAGQSGMSLLEAGSPQQQQVQQLQAQVHRPQVQPAGNPDFLQQLAMQQRLATSGLPLSYSSPTDLNQTNAQQTLMGRG